MSARVVRLVSIIVALLVTFVPACSYGQSSANNGGPGTISDKDRLLLEKIDRLERRIIELEARAGIEPTAKQSGPPIATSSNLSQETSQPATGKPAANPSEAPTQAEEPFAFADFTWLNGNSRT